MFTKLIEGKRHIDKKLRCSVIVLLKALRVTGAWVTSIIVLEANPTKFRLAGNK